jgi:ribosomal protein L33
MSQSFLALLSKLQGKECLIHVDTEGSPQDSALTEAKKDSYHDTEALREALARLEGKKFRLDCGHHVTFGCFLGNASPSSTVRN